MNEQNNNIGEKYLPIGTVVKLKEGKKRLMIIGFCAIPEEANDKIFDYSGCLYPEGLLSNTQIGLFNHDQIEFVYNVGFSDEEEKNFKNKLKEIADKKA